MGNGTFTITKSEEDKRQVFGWANVAVRKDGSIVADLQNDVIEPEELERAAYEYVLKFRDAGERHDPALRKKGKLIESVVFTKEKMAAIGIPEGTVPEGWWIGFKVEDDEAWKKIKTGEYRAFSIEGTGERVPYEPVEKSTKGREQVAKTFGQFFPKTAQTLLTFSVKKSTIRHSGAVAKSFTEAFEKFNLYHDAKGRFATADGAVDSGAVSGALNPLGDRAAKHAVLYYEEIRHMTTDVAKIAEATGYTEKQIQAIKNFIFVDEHDLGDRIARFDPDFMMAESWRRLMSGTPEPHDLTLIHHEIMESGLMKQGYTQDEAHKITSMVYNYKKEADAFYARIETFAKE